VALLDTARAVEQATTAAMVKRSGLLRAVTRANELYALRPPEVLACQSAMASAQPAVATNARACVSAFMSQISREPCAAARELDSAHRALQGLMQTLATEIENTHLASQKNAEFAANAMRAAVAEDTYDTRALTRFRQSKYSNDDPVATPLFLMAFTNPYARGGTTESWLSSWYQGLVGEEYAQAHPLVDPPREDETEGGGFDWGTLRYILPIALGLGGGIAVIWGLRKVGL